MLHFLMLNKTVCCQNLQANTCWRRLTPCAQMPLQCEPVAMALSAQHSALNKHCLSSRQYTVCTAQRLNRGCGCVLTCCRSAIWERMSCSMAVGSATACSATTRIMLASLTLGLGASSRPCWISSCRVFSRSVRRCVLSFLCSCAPPPTA